MSNYLKPGENRMTVGVSYSSPRSSTYIAQGGASNGGNGVVISGSPRTSQYTPTQGTVSAANVIGNYITSGGITSSPRTSTYIPSPGTNSTANVIGNYISSGTTQGQVISSSPRTSTYIPSQTTNAAANTIGRYINSGATSTYIANPSSGGFTTTTAARAIGGLVSGTSSNYVPGRTSGSYGTTGVAGLVGTYINSATGSTYVSSNTTSGKVLSGNEYSLQKQVERLEQQVTILKAEKDKLTVVVHDLKKYAPDYKGDRADDPDLDGSFLDLKHRNVVETLDMQVKQMKKKNKMLAEENDMLKTQVRALCAADDALNDKFLQSEVSKLHNKIRELRTKNEEMEIQIRTYESDKKYGVKNKGDVLNFDDGMRDDHERLKRELTNAYRKINDLESGENALSRANIDKYKALTNRVNELERQNQQLLNKMRDNQLDPMRVSGLVDSDKDREIFMLKKENDELREELMQKNETIRKLQSGKGGGEQAEAIQNLIAANERLLAQVMAYQERLNHSQSFNKSNMTHLESRRPKETGLLKSDYVDPYKDSRMTLD